MEMDGLQTESNNSSLHPSASLTRPFLTARRAFRSALPSIFRFW